LVVDASRSDTLAARGARAAVSSFFADDIVYLRAAAPPLFGRDAAGATFAANPSPAPGTTWQPIGGGVSRDALAGYTFGIAVMPRAEGSPVVGRYLAFWQRRRGGPWQLAAYAEVGAAAPAVKAVPEAMPVPATLHGAAQQIIYADSDFANDAALVGTAAAFGNAVAADGVVFGGPEIVFGPTAVRDLFESQRGTSLSWQPIYARAAASGDLGFSIGESVATARGQSGAAVQRFGKYLTIWRKEPNGDWKFVVDGGNARPSPVDH
jgi:ketosteroid isomerase-like protein